MLLVDHLPKSTTGQHGTSSYAGSTDWRNAARSVWTPGKDKEDSGDVRLHCDKSNYGPAPATMNLDNSGGCAWLATAAGGPSSGEHIPDDMCWDDLPV